MYEKRSMTARTLLTIRVRLSYTRFLRGGQLPRKQSAASEARKRSQEVTRETAIDVERNQRRPAYPEGEGYKAYRGNERSLAGL